MLIFDREMEKRYIQCVPFDEGDIIKSESYQEIQRELKATRKFLERRVPDTMACIDAYMSTYLELVELECRHYFAEGYRIGCGKVIQFKNISMSDIDSSF